MKNGYYYLFVYTTDLEKFNQVLDGGSAFIFAKTDSTGLGSNLLKSKNNQMMKPITQNMIGIIDINPKLIRRYVQ